MPLTVLSDSDVRDLLDCLTCDDVRALQATLRQALHEYSTGTTNEAACSTNQPERTALQSADGRTTLFMPSTSSSGIGMKVVTLGSPTENGDSTIKGDTSPRGALTIMSSNGSPIGFLNAEEVTAFRTALTSSLLMCRRARLKSLTVFGAGKQAFWHIRIALLLRGHSIKTVNIINRTFSDRARQTLKTFFAVDAATKEHEGWTDAKFSIMIPSYGEYERLIREQLRASDAIITTVPSTTPLFEPSILTSTEGRRRGRLIMAIGSYKPHMIELPTELLTQAVKPHDSHRHYHKHAPEGGVVVVDTLTGCLKEAGEIIQAGLSPMQLVEVGELVMLEGQNAPTPPPTTSSSSTTLGDDSNIGDLSDPELDLEKIKLSLRTSSSDTNSSMASVMRDDNSSTTTASSSSHHSHKKTSSRSSFHHSGSRTSSPSRSLLSPISPTGDGPGRMSRKSSFNRESKHTRSSSTSSSKASKSSKDDAMARWLSEGNVIYKSVGMGLMDLVVGAELVRLAVEKGIGTTIGEF